jgi:hypothetical protein
MEQCSECRFWLNWDSEMTNLGECHRFPPRMATVRRVDGDESAAATVRPEGGGWPLTAPDDWCGEFQRPLTPAAAPPKASSQPSTDVGPVGI